MSDKPEPITEYVHGAVGGKNYAVELAHHEGGSWAFHVIHIEGLPSIGNDGASWPSKEQAIAAVEAMISRLAH